MKVGFIGLGNMGAHLARNLLERSDNELIVLDVNRDKAAGLLALGATWGESPAAVASQSNVVITSVPGPAEVRLVMDGPDGVFQGIKSGSAWIETSTTDRDQLLEQATRMREKGCVTLEAPVTGGAVKAKQGTAAFFVGGPEEDFKRYRSVLDAMSAEVFYMGELGNGMTCKLITNMLGLSHQVILGEGLMLGKQAGLDLSVLAEAINGSFGTSFVSEYHARSIYDGSYDTKFSLALALKDLGLATSRAEEVGAPLYVAKAVQERFVLAADRYGTDAGDVSTARLLEDETGHDLRCDARPGDPFE